MQPQGATIGAGAAVASTAGISQEMQDLIGKLQELDQGAAKAAESPTALTKYTSERTDILMRIVSASSTSDEKAQWTRQIVDGLASSVQVAADQAALKKLKEFEAQTAKDAPKSDLAGYVVYRRMLADYTLALREPDAEKRQKVQQGWLDNLEQFIKDYPTAEDTPEAMLQLAINLEFSGKLKEARKYYDGLVKDHAETPAGQRATGAVKRIEMVGKPLNFTGADLSGKALSTDQFRGKVVMVAYWATWCVPCTQDLPQVRELYKKYASKGFEIVGVNIDLEKTPVDAYLKEHKVTWPQIHSAGGLESEAARNFGIVSLPTIFLIDTDGNVVAGNATVEDVKEFLAKKFDPPKKDSPKKQ